MDGKHTTNIPNHVKVSVIFISIKKTHFHENKFKQNRRKAL